MSTQRQRRPQQQLSFFNSSALKTLFLAMLVASIFSASAQAQEFLTLTAKSTTVTTSIQNGNNRDKETTITEAKKSILGSGALEESLRTIKTTETMCDNAEEGVTGKGIAVGFGIGAGSCLTVALVVWATLWFRKREKLDTPLPPGTSPYLQAIEERRVANNHLRASMVGGEPPAPPGAVVGNRQDSNILYSASRSSLVPQGAGNRESMQTMNGGRMSRLSVISRNTNGYATGYGSGRRNVSWWLVGQ